MPGENGTRSAPVRVAICDDESAQAEYLCALAREWAPGARVRAFSSAEALLFAGGQQADILLLDVEMPGMDGVRLAKELRARGFDAQIVFVTAFPDYMQAGYDVEAVHYLLKPIKKEQLFAVLDRARGRVARAERSVVLRAEGEDVRVRVSGILYAEALSHYARVRLADGGELRVKTRISDLQALLGEGFFRCQRSFLANMRRASRVSRAAIVMEDGAEIPIARGLHAEAARAFIDWN